MPRQPPEPLGLGGEDDFAAYQAYFDRLYRRGIIDRQGRRVTFDADCCRHVCFKEDPQYKNHPDLGRRYARTVWEQERADLIHWIELALIDPDEIRINHATRRHEAYLIAFPSIDIKIPQKRFYVSVELTRDPRWVQFKTAFPPDAKYWIDARRSKTGDKPIYKRNNQR